MIKGNNVYERGYEFPFFKGKGNEFHPATSDLMIAFTDKGVPVGAAKISTPDRSEDGFYLYRLYVAPKYRNKGLGQVIFDRVSKYAKVNKLELIDDWEPAVEKIAKKSKEADQHRNAKQVSIKEQKKKRPGTRKPR